MIFNKKGLSTVVTTLIIILLVLVAIGIIWVVIRGVVESGSESISVTTECLKIDVRASAVVCSTGNTSNCSVTLTRTAAGGVIGGVKLVFYNDTGGGNGGVKSLQVNVAPLVSVTNTSILTGVTNPKKVDVTAFLLVDGLEQICGQTTQAGIA